MIRFLARFWSDFWPGFGQENTAYSSTGTKIGHTLTIYVILKPTRKTGYPLTTSDVTKRYLFVNDYIYERERERYTIVQGL